jgi:hypothetical protein
LKWTLIRGKRPSAIAVAIPTVVAFVVAMTVIVTVGVVLTSAGCILAAMRRQSRIKKVLSDRYMLPEGHVDSYSRSAPSNTVTRSKAETSFRMDGGNKGAKSPETQIATGDGQLRICCAVRCPTPRLICGRMALWSPPNRKPSRPAVGCVFHQQSLCLNGMSTLAQTNAA